MSAFVSTRRYYEIAVSYTVNEDNGNPAVQYESKFPSGKFIEIYYEPTWSHHRFLGWYNVAAQPNQAGSTSGMQLNFLSELSSSGNEAHAQWQLPATITFNATDGSQIQSGWTAPDYYAGLTYGTLPTATLLHHRFLGWYSTYTAPQQSATPQGTHILATSTVQQTSQQLYTAWQLPATVTFDATTNGGQMPSGWTAPDYYIGQTYGTLPQPTKQGEAFIGWYDSSNNLITTTSIVQNTSLTARYMSVTYATSFEVQPYSSYLKAGIYSATRKDSSMPIIVDWGDGTTNSVFGNISQLTHSYASAGTYTVKVSDNITTFALSRTLTTWVATTTKNRYIVSKILSISSNVTSIPNNGFYYCQALSSVNLGNSGSLALGTNVFSYCLNLNTITSNMPTAPTVQSSTFGSSTTTYAGRNTYSAGTNKLYVPSGATGYDSSYWSSVLLDSTKCGFTKEEIT